MKALVIHQEFTVKVQNERASIHEVLMGIIELDKTRAYLELGYPSLFEYLVHAQKYSEGSAQRRISAARLMNEVPEVQTKLQDGEINLTQLSKLSSAIKVDQKETGVKVSAAQKKELVAKLEGKNGFETDKILNEELHYTFQTKEKVIPKNEDVFLNIKLSNTQFEKLKQAQEILSHVHHKGSFADIIETLCDKLISQKEKSAAVQGTPAGNFKDKSAQDPRSKVKESAESSNKSAAQSEKAQHNISTAATAVKWTYREFIPRATQRYIYHKANYCCEYVSAETGQRCGSRYQTQIDHTVPLARGGKSNPENLRVLCRAHNLSEARRWGLCH